MSGRGRVYLDRIPTRRRWRQRPRGTSGGGDVTTIPWPLFGLVGRVDRALISIGIRALWGGEEVNASTSLPLGRPLSVGVEDVSTSWWLLHHDFYKTSTSVKKQQRRPTEVIKKTYTLKGRPSCRLGIGTDQHPGWKLPRECVKERENL